MKSLFLSMVFVCSVVSAQAQQPVSYVRGQQWKSTLHTALAEAYLGEEEKMVFYYLNLARTQPRYFADSVLKTYKGVPRHDNSYLKSSPYVASLYTHLMNMKPLPPLQPDRTLFASAHCFAEAAGKKGIVGHDRKGTDCSLRAAECCSYGMETGLDIVLQLLIDKGIENLAHRQICLGPYTRMGIAIRPHKDYRQNAVLNFK
jgi:uncharacterized protein YkwD